MTVRNQHSPHAVHHRSRVAALACIFLVATLGAKSLPQDAILIRQILHVDPMPLEVEAKSYGSFSPAPGVTADRVSYATAYGLRIPGIVYHPQDRGGKRPALIVVNGHGGDKSSWYAYWAGILYARAGAVVLTYDPIGEFERNHLRMTATSQHDPYMGPDDMARRMAGLMVEDVLQGVSYLSERKDVDRKRIAVLGYSMGSFISSLACAAATNVHACVLVGGGDLDGPGGYWDSSGRRMCQGIPYQSLRPLGDRGAAIFALNALRGPTLIYNGLADQVVDIPHHGPDFFADLQRRTEARLGGHSKAIFQTAFLPGGGHRPYFVTKPVALWLNKELHFPNWSGDAIRKMPETHISEWAAEHDLPGSGFKNQVGEGGMLALGNDIPVVDRAALHAVPESVWTEHRDRYVYESWVALAQAAVLSDVR